MASRSLPLVTIVMPGRDVAPYVGDALSSLTRQFDDPSLMEVIFVDDGSSDETSSVVERYSNRLPNLTVLRNESSEGVSAARNRAISVANGRYLIFLDADDWYAPGHLAVLVEGMERIGCDFIRTDIVVANGANRTINFAPQARRGVSHPPRAAILPVNARTMVDHPHPQAGIYQTSLRERGLMCFDEALPTSECRLWNFGLHLKANSYAVIDTPGFIYRKGTATSLTEVVDSRRLGYLKAYDKIRELVEQDREGELWMPKVIQTVLGLTAFHMRSYNLMAPDVQRAFIEGASELLASFPSRSVRERVAAMDRKRLLVLEPVVRPYLDERVA